MKKTWMFIGAAMVLAGLLTIFLWKPAKKDVQEPVQLKTAVPDALTETDRTVLLTAFEEPEAFHQETSEIDSALEENLVRYADLSGRPVLMSEKEAKAQPRERVAHVNTNRPRFMNTFSSLRTDEVRSPDSEQNRAAVRSIMKKRQDRVSQLENRIEL